uniref:Uncharacterized protein n=1 Tax=Rhizophora mucronata TaxID=61149 RepID=A0A2P2QDW6_RHIMU
MLILWPSNLLYSLKHNDCFCCLIFEAVTYLLLLD